MLERKLIAIGFVAIAIGFVAYMAASAQDESEDRQPPPKTPMMTHDKEPPPPMRDSDDPRSRRMDEWGPPSMPPPGVLPPGGPGGNMQPPMQPPMMRPPHDSMMENGPGGRPFPDWASLEKRDPEMFKLLKQEMDLERQTRYLVEDYRRASSSKRDDIKKQVMNLVDQQFEVRQQRRQLELKKFNEELQRLRDAIEHRNQARKQIVEKRVTELLGQEEDVSF